MASAASRRVPRDGDRRRRVNFYFHPNPRRKFFHRAEQIGNGHPAQLADAYTKPFVDFLESSIPEPNVYKGQEIKEILWAEIENAWYGRKAPRNALLDAKQRIDAILKEYY